MGRVVPALARGLDILELLLDGRALPATEIAAALGLPRTTVHELLQTLVARHYLEAVDGAPRRYRLGVRLFELGNVYAAGLDLARAGQPIAAEVAAACQETVHVAVLDGRDVVYVAKVDSTHPVRMVSAVGRRLPAHLTAVGKMLLSALPEPELDARYPRTGRLEGLTPASITSPAELRRALATIRAEGLAWDHCESNPAVNCVAAPVRDHTGAVVAAMSISVPTVRWSKASARQWAELVADGAARLSRRLGAPTAPETPIQVVAS